MSLDAIRGRRSSERQQIREPSLGVLVTVAFSTSPHVVSIAKAAAQNTQPLAPWSVVASHETASFGQHPRRRIAPYE